MPKIPDTSRREFLSNSGKLVMGETLLTLATTSADALPPQPAPGPPNALAKSQLEVGEFFFGADVYPELQTREEWNRMLDHFQRAQMNAVRVSESSWGNLETASGEFDFGWLHNFLDDLERRKMKAILGTGSYLPPQWLAAGNPDILVQLHPGVKAHPMARHAPCLSHPLYRSALREYILAMGKAFHEHPTVIAWQLGNEQEGAVTRLCYNPACEKAWREWLKKTYRTPEEFNRRLNLVSWGMKVRSLDEVPQPGEGVEESGKEIAALSLAHRHFRRDVLLDFFAMQAEALREAGVKQWIITDWNTGWDAVADDPQAGEIMDIAGLNYYQPWADNAEFWSDLSLAPGHASLRLWAPAFHHHGKPVRSDGWHLYLGSVSFARAIPHVWARGRRIRNLRAVLLDRQSLARRALAALGRAARLVRPSRAGFRLGGGVGADIPEMGEAPHRQPGEGHRRGSHGLRQRAALEIYPHIKPSPTVLPQSFDALHRLGIGVDSMNLAKAASASNLTKYSLVLVPAATALDNPRSPPLSRLSPRAEEWWSSLLSPPTWTGTEYSAVTGSPRTCES